MRPASVVQPLELEDGPAHGSVVSKHMDVDDDFNLLLPGNADNAAGELPPPPADPDSDDRKEDWYFQVVGGGNFNRHTFVGQKPRAFTSLIQSYTCLEFGPGFVKLHPCRQSSFTDLEACSLSQLDCMKVWRDCSEEKRGEVSFFAREHRGFDVDGQALSLALHCTFTNILTVPWTCQSLPIWLAGTNFQFICC